VYTATTGTGTLSLGAAVTGFRAFSDAVTAGALTSGATIYYAIEDAGLTWEIGVGTYVHGAPDTLTRAVAASSLGGTTVLPLTGAAQVYLTLTAAAIVAAYITSGTIINTPIGALTANIAKFTALIANTLVVNNATSGAYGITINAATNPNGANLKFIGSGATTPNKTIRAVNGNLGIANSANNIQILTLTDAGNLSTSGGIDATIIGATSPASGTFTDINATSLSLGSDIGPQVNLFSTFYGLGINGNELTAFVPTNAWLSICGAGVVTGSNVWQTDYLGNVYLFGGAVTSAGNIVATQPWVQANAAPTEAINNNGRNRVRNSRFLINQRGIGPFSTGVAYCSDGWITSTNPTTGTATVSGPSAAYGYSGFVTVTAGITSVSVGVLQVLQRIESTEVVDLIGQTITMSFYGSATVSTGTASVTIGILYPSANNYFSSTLTEVGAEQPVTLTGTPTRVSATFTNMPAGIVNGFEIQVSMKVSAVPCTATLTVGGVQVELGSTVSPLEHRVIGHEMMINQRYYQTVGANVRAYSTGTGWFDASIHYTNMTFTPTATLITAGSQSNTSSATLVPANYGANSGRFEIATPGAGDTYALGYLYGLSGEY
jgi:hypothetical protein